MTPFTSTGVVAWSETDASGRYHFTAPYRWAENTEHALYRSLVPGLDVARLPRRTSSATFDGSLIAGDRYSVELAVERLGTTSITYIWTVTGPARVCVRGSHTVVHLDEDGHPADLPAALRTELTRHLVDATNT